MQNETNPGDGQPAAPEVACENAGEATQVIVLSGDPFDGQSLADLVKDGDVTEATIRGHRVIIVGDMHHSRHLALAAVARLAAEGMLVVASEQEIVRPRLEELPQIVLKEPEVVEDFGYGKGKRRKPWESPHGYHGGKHQRRNDSQRVKQMMRRRGGR